MPTPSNHARVGQAITILAESLGPWISKTLDGRLPAGASWTSLLRIKDGRDDRLYSEDDLQCQLRVITERMGDYGFLFNGVLSRGEQNLAGELRDVRNSWAHSANFSSDDAYRALDTAERLLRAVNDPASADRVRRLRLDVQRSTYDSATRRDTRSAAVAMPGLGADGITPWREVVRPHADIISGDFGQAEYAADLHQVSIGEGAPEYVDPVRFYERTYLTRGLRTLLAMAARRLSGDANAQAVINLQTTFGGGKTHSMLAAWHLAGGTPLVDLPQDVQEALEGIAPPDGIRRVAIVGNEISPGQPSVKEDGTEVRTLWGELAWQLGGAEGYALVADADRTGTNPGSALRTLIAGYSPALILIDEWVAYARGLYKRDDLAGGSFDTQFTFAQELTAAVQGTLGAVLLVSIPASDIRADGTATRASELEIGGDGGREALQRLQHVVSRVAHNWSPASSSESFEIVRRRLFSDLDADARRKRDETIKRFLDYYRKQRNELPGDTIQIEYESRMRDAYPIHPELFDRLYGDWSSLERFQRTRGVLRLMSAVVHSLAAAQDDSPLIMPGSIPFDDTAVRDEIAAYLDDSWRTIIEKDVDGENATPLHIDRSRPLFGRRALTRRIARALFLGSAAAADTARKGIDRQRLFLGVAMPGDTLGNFGSSLQMLADQATYVYTEGGRSWYDRRPSINRFVADRAASYEPADVEAEAVTMLGRLAGRAPEFGAVIVAPETSADVPEAEAARLVLLAPGQAVTGKAPSASGPGVEAMESLLRTRGTGLRANANTIIGIAPDAAKWETAERLLRTAMAWRHVAGDSIIREHDFTQSEADLVKRKSRESEDAAMRELGRAWCWALHPVQTDGSAPFTVEAARVDGDEPRIAVRAAARLKKLELLITSFSPTALALDLEGPNLRAKWNEGRVDLGTLWSYYLRHPFMPRLRDKRVLIDAVAAMMNEIGWESRGFALARGYDATRGDFIGLAIPCEDEPPQIGDDTLLVAPRLARVQRTREEQAAAADRSPDPAPSRTPGASATTPVRPGRPGEADPASTDADARPAVPNASFTGEASIDAGRDIAAQLAQIHDEIIAHLKAADPDLLDVRIEITARRYAGFDERTVRTVNENARTIGLIPGKFTEG